MSTSLTLQQPLARHEGEPAPQRRTFVKQVGTCLLALSSMAVAGGGKAAQPRPASAATSTTQPSASRVPEDAENFYRSPAITTLKVRFKNQYDMDVAGSLFVPNNMNRAAEPKELYWVPGAGHVDLYDRVSLIPWAKLTAFFRQHLAQQGTPIDPVKAPSSH